MTDLVFLHNPSSRRGRDVAAKVRALADGVGFAGRARWIAVSDAGAELEKEGRVVAVGGDGTANAAATWIHSSGSSCSLAIIPAGTGNNLARGLAIPLATEPAFRLAVGDGRLQPLDAIRYTGSDESSPRLMIQTSALGFPAEIAARYDRLRRHGLLRFLFRPLGPRVYRLLGLTGLVGQKIREWRRRGMLDVRLELPGESIDERVFAIFIGNEATLGGNFHPCPEARVDDGKLDICMVRAGTGERYLRIFGELSKGRHLSLSRTVLYRQTPGPVELSLSRPSAFLVDGDLWMESKRYRLEVLPGAVQVVVPDNERSDHDG